MASLPLLSLHIALMLLAVLFPLDRTLDSVSEISYTPSAIKFL